MRKATLACLAAALGATLALPSVAPAQEFPPASRFQKVTLNDRPGEPMALAVLPDGRVLHSARTGEIRLFSSKTGLNTMAADMRDGAAGLYQHDEEGVQGVALDLNFAQNKWVYVYCSPKLNTPVDVPARASTRATRRRTSTTPEERARLPLFKGAIRLSRFKFEGSELDLGSEQKIIDVPVDRGICCHVGGKIDFDGEGNLYLSTGDDTNPFESVGVLADRERSNRNPAFDAQRSSANTNDLRGKILRIRVEAGGGYSVPAGQPVPVRSRAHPARDLRHGLPQPVPHGGRQEVQQRLRGRLLARCAGARSHSAARRASAAGCSWDRPGNYGWPYCMTPHDRLTWTTTSPPREVRRGVLPRTRSTSRRTTPVAACCRRSSSRMSTTAIRPTTSACSRSCSRTTTETASDRWAARRTTSRPTAGPRPSGRTCSTGTRCSTSGRGTTSRSSSSTARTATGSRDIHNLFPGGPNGDHPGQPDGRGVRPGRRALHARVRRRVLPRAPEAQLGRIDFVRGNEFTPIPEGDRGQDRGSPGPAAHGELLERRDARTPMATPSRTRGTSTPTARSTRARRTRHSPTPSAASTRPRCG